LPNLRAWCAAWAKRTLARVLWAPALALIGLTPNSTESANANGETRTLNLAEPHTNETGSFTYMVNGAYDQAVLEKLNWFLRDWRHDEQTHMDPKLFDIVWEVYRESGSSQPVEILSAYRSPQTNAMLRRRSRLVAEHSLHIQGRAMDAHFVDVSTARIRDIAMRMQDGGVGFYPTGATPWVHIDSGSVRYWPRMSRDALARIFPDGKTVDIPADGVPMPGYEQARADIEARGGTVFAATAYAGHPKSLLAMLFGGGEDEGDEEAVADTRRGGTTMSFAAASPQPRGGTGQQPPPLAASAHPDPVSLAKRDLPQGETFIGPAPPANAPKPEAAKPEMVASLEPREANDGSEGAVLIPTPPHRPSEFVSATLGYGPAPTPPSRPVEFAALQSRPPDGADAAHKNDAITALLTRRLPGVITRGLSGPLPKNALALTDPDAPVSPERIALLAKAAALSATLPPQPRMAPLERAARLYAPLPPIEGAPLKPALVAAKIDQSDFDVMTAPKTPTAMLGALKAAAPASPRADALVVALAPVAEVQATFGADPAGDLRPDAFARSPAVSDPRGALTTSDADALRGTD
jgi:uncharacterized protein YcbK (DUF882 family)